MFGLPHCESVNQLLTVVLNVLPCGPFINRLFTELYKYAFATILNCWNPRYLSGNICSLDTNLQLTFNVGRRSLESRESNLSHNLTQTVYKYDSLDAFHPWLIPVLLG